MKQFKDLEKKQKIEFLRAVERGEVNIKNMKGKQPLFLFNRSDVWRFLSIGCTQTGVAFSDEAKETVKLLNEAIKQGNKQNQQSINQ